MVWLGMMEFLVLVIVSSIYPMLILTTEEQGTLLEKAIMITERVILLIDMEMKMFLGRLLPNQILV